MVARSRTSAAEISPTTITFRTRRFQRSPIALRLAGRNASPARGPAIAPSGATVRSAVTTAVTPTTNTTTVRSKPTSSRRGIEAGARSIATRINCAPTSHPRMLPLTASSSASTVSWRVRWTRDAPIAIRIASSARRPFARTSASDTRFASAVARTTSTAASRMSIDRRKSATSTSCNGSSRTASLRAYSTGNCWRSARQMAVSSACA